MTGISTELVRLVEVKGWLAVSDIIFDNTVRVTVPTMRGLMAINKTKGLFYFMDVSGLGADVAFNYLANSGLADGFTRTNKIGADFSAFHDLRVMDLDILQNFSLQTWNRIGVTENIVNEDLQLPVPTINTKTPVFTSGEHPTTAMFGDLSAYAAVENIETLETLFMNKDAYDTFTNAQGKFKTYVKSFLSLPDTDELI